MHIALTKIFRFSSAHFLPDYHGKCERLHGHTYKLEVTVFGKPNANGLLVDFLFLKKVVEKEVLAHLDHTLLNDVVKNPSAENLAHWIFQKLKNLPALLKNTARDPEYLDSLMPYLKEKKLTPAPILDFKNIKLKKITLWESETSCVELEV